MNLTPPEFYIFKLNLLACLSDNYNIFNMILILPIFIVSYK